jgi:fatty acid desaturase
MTMLDRGDVFVDTIELKSIRSYLHTALGRERVMAAHKQRLWLDAMVVAGFLLAYYGGFVALGIVELPLWGLLAWTLLQGALIVSMAMLSHDLFEHRQAWPGWRQEWLSASLFLPATTPSSIHRVGHLRHHAKIGTSGDTEASLIHVNSRLRRLLFCTAIGYLVARSGRWGRSEHGGYEAFLGASARDMLLRRRETWLFLAWLVLNLILLTTPYWRAAVFGFFLPIAVVATFLSSVRVILEHGHLDPGNPWSMATYYRTGWLTKALFMVNAGDSHLVHHIFPRVPWYNMPELVRLVEPHLLAHGVKPIDSIWRLLWDWFVLNKPHRSDWT